MSIIKMKAVTIAGQISEFDSIVEKYVYGRDIHLENAMSVLTNRGRLASFEDNNEYDSIAKTAMSIMKLAKYNVNKKLIAPESTRLEEMQKFLDDINLNIENEKKQDEQLTQKIKANETAITQMDLMLSVDVDLSRIFKFEFIHCKFGHIPKAGYKTLVTYLDNLEAFFIKTAEDATDVWGFYFAPLLKERKVEEVFNSLYFEAVELSRELIGTPYEIKKQLVKQNQELKAQIEENSAKTAQMLSSNADRLCGIYNLAKKRSQFSEVRRNAVHGDMFFYIVGWMDEKHALALEKEVNESGDVVMFYTEDAENIKNMQPPTKLKNNPVFKPFEMFVKMYGLPSFNEIDPTPILAITYILFFGIMFGDVGQSLVLAIAGFIVYKMKKWDLGGIVGWVGLSGVVFGFIYGSFFGNEEIIPNLLHTTPIRPMEQAIMMLGATIGMGVLIIIFGMVLNIINAIKSKNKGEALFGHNGAAGLVFYLSVLLLAANLFLKWGIPTVVFVVLIVVSVLAMYMCEPLSDLVAGKKHWWPKTSMYFVENLFEMFEVILSFFTNTISFLRIGAFAIVHVGMMMVVAILTPDGISIGSILVQVIGNGVVMVLEGLIVGIQVLRLEYYEMFSRYFTGRGKEFISLKDK
ncbi:MAG: V-type ATPase 116kDa subunit family protein [Clostridia bacterium]|nr:V-type ATPase 116kDa subunit family protein [Clostridia bacterium]